MHKNKRPYKALFIAPIGAEFTLVEHGWEVSGTSLPKTEVAKFLEETLNLRSVKEVCGVVKYVNTNVEASMILSEENMNDVESVYLQCFGDTESVKRLFLNSNLVNCAELFDPEQH